MFNSHSLLYKYFLSDYQLSFEEELLHYFVFLFVSHFRESIWYMLKCSHGLKLNLNNVSVKHKLINTHLLRHTAKCLLTCASVYDTQSCQTICCITELLRRLTDWELLPAELLTTLIIIIIIINTQTNTSAVRDGKQHHLHYTAHSVIKICQPAERSNDVTSWK